MGILSGQQKPVTQAAQPQGQSSAEETYKRLGQAVMKVVYAKPTSDQLLEILKTGADNPPNAVAQAAMAVLGRLEAEVQGIEPKLVYSVAPIAVVELLGLGKAARLFEPTTAMIGEALKVLAEMTKEQAPQEDATQMPQPQPMGA